MSDKKNQENIEVYQLSMLVPESGLWQPLDGAKLINKKKVFKCKKKLLKEITSFVNTNEMYPKSFAYSFQVKVGKKNSFNN